MTSSPLADGSTSVVVAGLGSFSPPATRELCAGTLAPRSAASESSCESFAKLLADGSTTATSTAPGMWTLKVLLVKPEVGSMTVMVPIALVVTAVGRGERT